MKQYFFIYILLIFHKEIFSIPLKISFKSINNGPKPFIYYLINNEIFTYLKLGTPEQKILSYISFNTSFLYIPGKNLDSKYNEEKSSSYIKRKKDEITFFNEPIINGFLSNETFYFENYNNKKIIFENFPFILSNYSINNNFKQFGLIGLKFKEELLTKDYPFTNYLKELNLIKNEIFTFEFNKKSDKETEGNLIIGENIHEYNNKFKENNFYLTKVLTSFGMGNNWILKLPNITFGNINIKIQKVAYIKIEYGVIFAPLELINIIENEFFNQLIKEKKCFKNIFLEQYIYYYCNENVDISKFKDFNFYCEELNYNFNFNYNDIFILHDKKYYFLILFDTKNGFFWTFGKPFLYKYQLVFNSYKKTIGIYHENKSNTYYTYIILIIMFIIILIFIFIIIKQKKQILKKKKATELIEDIESPKIKILD